MVLEMKCDNIKKKIGCPYFYCGECTFKKLKCDKDACRMKIKDLRVKYHELNIGA